MTRSAPAVAVDVAALTVLDGAPHALLVRPRRGAFAGAWALPGGRVQLEESLDQAARRELAVHLDPRGVYLEQLYTFGSPQRDPGGRVVSVAYLALAPRGGRPSTPGATGGPAKYAARTWRRASRLPPLGYDHRTVVRIAVGRLRAKLAYTNLAYSLLPSTFTLGELQDTYEAVLGRTLDRRNFRRRMLALGLLRSLDGQRRGRHRPAALWAFRHRRPTLIEPL